MFERGRIFVPEPVRGRFVRAGAYKSSGPPLCSYSPKRAEAAFSEVRINTKDGVANGGFGKDPCQKDRKDKVVKCRTKKRPK